MCSLRDRIRRVAPHPLTVLLEGETGTGKELVARALHRQSRRRAGPFAAVNCAAIPENLAESHLFGHEAGAFTGARGLHRGVLEQAQGGTLFLDEIAELGLPLQAKLLRSLQEREVVRVGSQRASKPVQLDIRVIAASHEDLVASCRDGRFRDDLYYRLREYRLQVPPLRDRERDAVELARHFLASVRGPRVRLGRDAQELLLTYPWPGNVRELRAAVLAARVDARRGRIGAEELREHLAVARGHDEVFVEASAPSSSSASRREIVLGQLREGGRASISELEERTGIPRSSLRRLLGRLADEEVVDHVGDGRARRYSLAAERDHPDPATAGATVAEGRRATAHDYLRSQGHLTRRIYMELTGVSARTANRDLQELVDRGLIQSNGRKGRAAGYLLAPAGPAGKRDG